MWRKIRISCGVVAILGISAGPGWVQAQQSVPGSLNAGSSLEGTVKKVNPATSSVEVSTDRFGLWAKSLEVSSTTEIRVEGRKASLEDLHEGERVRASYETRVGKSFATSIEIIPTPEPRVIPGHATPQAGPTSQ